MRAKGQQTRLRFLLSTSPAASTPTPPLKDAGLPRLGQIPKHWQCSSLRCFWSVTDCKHLTLPFLDEGIPLASVSEVTLG